MSIAHTFAKIATTLYPAQRAYDIVTTSLLRQIDAATSFWRNNGVIITPFDPWDYTMEEESMMNNYVWRYQEKNVYYND